MLSDQGVDRCIDQPVFDRIIDFLFNAATTSPTELPITGA
jgi:hypothetical protein